MQQFFVTLLMVVAISGCTSINSFSGLFSSENKPEISYKSPDYIRFTGKGAAASFALMSSMGPVGAAIGIAIDEGIAKEIRQNAADSNLDVKQIINYQIFNSEIYNQYDTVSVLEYGFEIKDGSKDFVAAKILLNACVKESCKDYQLSSWDKFEQSNLVTLDMLKTDSNSIKYLFETAFVLKKSE